MELDSERLTSLSETYSLVSGERWGRIIIDFNAIWAAKSDIARTEVLVEFYEMFHELIENMKPDHMVDPDVTL